MEEIVKGKPLPTYSRKGAAAKYPWGEMQPGDAFRYPAHITAGSASSMANHAGHQWQRKFAVRKDSDGCIWCWRVDGTPYEHVNGNVRQEIGVERRGYTPENTDGMVVTSDKPMDLPPIPKTASQLKTEEILAERKANLAAMGERDDI